MREVKICVYSIAKNEAKHVYRWFSSVRDADAIVVLDTGSSDNTVNKLLKCGVQVEYYNHHEFRFDRARNQAHSLCPQGPEWVYVWLDLDEVMTEGWYASLVNAVQLSEPNITGWNFVLQNGEVSYNRLSAHVWTYAWKYHAHEVLEYTGDGREREVFTSIITRHVPDMTKPRNYLDLLRASAESYADARSVRYYARECYYHKLMDEAIKQYQLAASLEQNQLLLCEIYIELGHVYAELGNLNDAKQAYIYASWTAPYIREGWGALATFCLRTQAYQEAISAIIQMRYVSQKPSHTIMVFEPYYNEFPDHMLATCYDYLGQNELARHHINQALARSPKDMPILRDFAKINGLTFDNLTVSEHT